MLYLYNIGDFHMDNPFKIITGLFNKSSESVVGIDIGASAIKIVQLRKKAGQAILETYGELSLGPYAQIDIGRATHLSSDKLAEALNDVLRESNTTTKKCGLAIPLVASLVSLIELPSAPSAQLAQMIPLEARKYIPVPVTEVVLDWWIIPQEEVRAFPISPGSPDAITQKQMTDVLVVAIHNEAINKYQDVVNKTAIDSSFFEIEIFSTMRSVLQEENASAMIFDFGAGTTKLYIVDRGIVRVSHTINRGSQDITLAMARGFNVSVSEAENIKRTYGLTYKTELVDSSTIISATLNFIFSEANRVLLGYERKYNKSIPSIILTGGGVNLKGFYEMAKSSFQVPVVMADPFAKLQAPAFLDPVFRSVGTEFAVAIGVALRRLQEVS